MSRPTLLRFISYGTRIILVLIALFFVIPASAQNTKGDQPVGNQRKVRETKGKSVKKKEKGVTRDIAGRRLRTKDKSSANRANVGIRQPDPYAKRKRVTTDHAAKPRTPIYTEKPTERARAWRGDISGFPQRKVTPRKAEAARANVFPNRGPFVNNPSRTPRGEHSPRVHTRTATGRPIVTRHPAPQERAWKGNLRGGPVGSPPSRTGTIRNILPGANQYAQYRKNTAKGDRSVGNKRIVSKAARMGTDQARGGAIGGDGIPSRSRLFLQGGQGPPGSGSRLFIQRGRKNAYWGKYSKGERAITTDIAGRPLRTRNFRSVPAGLVGRDTLKFFGRRPGGDISFKNQPGKGRETARPSAQKGWIGDVSGWKLRRLQPQSREHAGAMVFPRKLSNSDFGNRVGKRLPSAPISGRGRGERAGERIPNRPPGSGAVMISRSLGRYKGVKPLKGGGSASGALWNNNRSAIQGKVLPGNADRPIGFSGFLRGGSGKTFEDQGEGFSGYTKTKRPLKGGGSVSGRLWNNNRSAIQGRVLPGDADRPIGFSGFLRGGSGKTFEDQGEGFSGYIKTKKPLKGGGSVSGKLWNNNRTAIQGRVLPGDADRPIGFAGFLRGGSGKTFEDQGEGFSGYIKTKKPLKGGGSVSGKLWNNNHTAIQGRVLPGDADRPIGFSGFLRGGSGKTFEDQGEGFSGYIKTKKPLKGGGSVSGKLWNNNRTAIQGRVLPGDADRPIGFSGFLRGGSGKTFEDQGEGFSGYIKTRKPEKGGGSVSGKLWNNREEPTTVLNAGKYSVRAGQFQGDLKTKGPEKGGGSVSGKLWNNREQPIQVRVSTLSDVKGANFGGNNKIKSQFTQNPNAVDESLKKRKPGSNTYHADDLQVSVKRGNYEKRDHSAKGSLPGVGPKKSSVKASEFAKGMKMLKSKHNPNSSDDALKVMYLGKAAGRPQDFQGNVRMKKFNSRDLHPDAKFAHSGDNNVKEERTILLNVKLFWSKLFHKTESQPDHLKEKNKSPKYDKGEKGLWYD